MVMLSLIKSGTTASSVIDFPTALTLRRGKYLVRLAETKIEVDAALRLRFAVFNVELGEGFARSFANSKDEDLFDRKCEHVLIVERVTNQIVGTCRLRALDPGKTDAECFSSTRFKLATIPESVLHRSVEFGRACIAKPHRNKDSFKLLWSFLSRYAEENQKRYLIGCCSIRSLDPVAGGLLFEWLLQSGHVHSEFRVVPKPGSKCIFYKSLPFRSARLLPSPLHSYLKFGAKVCGLPAIDREFRTIDFFTLLDLDGANRNRTQLISCAP